MWWRTGKAFMRRYPFSIVFTVLCLVSVANSQQNDRLPRIGSELDRHTIAIAQKQRQICMTSPAQLDPCFEHTYGGVKFTVAYRSDTKKVTYIFTTDDKFRTDDGLKVLDEISVTEQSIRAWPGWQVEAAATSDGWVPVISDFDMKVKLTDGTLLNLPGENGGSSSGKAIIHAFGKHREASPTT
jgi:hypothetical protein